MIAGSRSTSFASLPARERGSKRCKPQPPMSPAGVAPRAGARIETRSRRKSPTKTQRSLPARERGSKLVHAIGNCNVIKVAPRAGARIETGLIMQ